MIKIGNWYINDNKHPGVIERQLLSENFHCADPLLKAIEFCDNVENAIDVGCWIGDSTWVLSKHFKNIYSFEANTDTYNCCVKNCFENNINNAIIYNVGLSNEIGYKDFYHSKSGYAGFVSTKDDQLDKFHKTQILTNTLDYYNFTNIDFLKIDIDSHESYFLLGAKKFFENNNPVVMIESKPRVSDRQPDEIPNAKEILNNYGYQPVAKVAKADFIYKRG